VSRSREQDAWVEAWANRYPAAQEPKRRGRIRGRYSRGAWLLASAIAFAVLFVPAFAIAQGGGQQTFTSSARYTVLSRNTGNGSGETVYNTMTTTKFVNESKTKGKPMRMIEEPMLYQPIGVGMAKDNPALTAKINEVLRTLDASGEINKIWDKWLGPNTEYKMTRTDKVVPLSEARRTAVRDKFRDKFRGEEPVVEDGLQCIKCRRVYPIVSDIPVMLVDEAFEEA